MLGTRISSSATIWVRISAHPLGSIDVKPYEHFFWRTDLLHIVMNAMIRSVTPQLTSICELVNNLSRCFPFRYDHLRPSEEMVITAHLQLQAGVAQQAWPGCVKMSCKRSWSKVPTDRKATSHLWNRWFFQSKIHTNITIWPTPERRIVGNNAAHSNEKSWVSSKNEIVFRGFDRTNWKLIWNTDVYNTSASSHKVTAGMGCLSCARGKFLKAHPFSYPLWARPHDSIFSKDLGLENSLKLWS